MHNYPKLPLEASLIGSCDYIVKLAKTVKQHKFYYLDWLKSRKALMVKPEKYKTSL